MKCLASLIAVAFAAPVHAVSIVSLHGGMGVPMVNPGTDGILLSVGVAVLGAVVAFRLLKRGKAGKQ